VAVMVLFAHYKERDSYYCQACWSKKDVFEWRLGSWMGRSFPVTPRWERITETRFLHDFLPAKHLHDWMFAQGSPYLFFGATSGGCVIGPGRHVSQICELYDLSPEFRAFLQAKLQDGSLVKSNLTTLVLRRVGVDSRKGDLLR
jgi:hypothetical protein